MFRIPESDRVEEAFGILVGELQRPVLTGVAGLIDARPVTGTGAHHIDGTRVDGLDAAEIQRFRACYLGGMPGGAAIGSYEPCADAPARPSGSRVHRTDTA
jgi:hypothetical protein